MGGVIPTLYSRRRLSQRLLPESLEGLYIHDLTTNSLGGVRVVELEGLGKRAGAGALANFEG